MCTLFYAQFTALEDGRRDLFQRDIGERQSKVMAGFAEGRG
jgi:hypothetical protein